MHCNARALVCESFVLNRSKVGELWRQTAGAAPVQVGEKAPDFTLEDQERKKVTLSSQFGKTMTVLVFYRGSW
jgi:hypothetical protein